MPAVPRSPYAVAKLAGEHYCRAFTATFGLPTFSLRYFNVFGPRQDPASDYAAVIPRFARALLRGEAPVIYGDGTQSRDFTYIDNVVDANLRAATAGSDAFGRTFNVAQGGRYSLLELVSLLAGILGVPDVHPTFKAERPWRREAQPGRHRPRVSCWGTTRGCRSRKASVEPSSGSGPRRRRKGPDARRGSPFGR